MDRRRAIHHIARLVGGALSAPTVAGLMAGCEARTSPASFVPRALDPGRFRAITLLADAIIPETDTPGASGAGVPRFIDDMLADFYTAELRTTFTEGLDAVEGECQTRFGVGLAEASEAQLLELLEPLDEAAFPPEGQVPTPSTGGEQGTTRFWRLLKELTVSGYYTSEVGATLELQAPPLGAYEADLPMDQVGRTWA